MPDENRPQAAFCEACGTPQSPHPNNPPAPSYAELTSALTEALEQQTATAEILRVISRSQAEVQPVFDAIVTSAVSLCDGLFSALFQFDGELIRQVAHHNFTPEALEAQHRVYPARPGRGLGAARAILDRAVVHIPTSNSIRSSGLKRSPAQSVGEAVSSSPCFGNARPSAPSWWRVRARTVLG